MIGVVGCAAEAGTTPTPSPTPTGSVSGSASASPTAAVPRQDIGVQLNPDQVTAGVTSKVWILANCPVPTGGPAHSGTASSKAFITDVTLNPVLATPSATATSTATATATSTAKPGTSPWVRGEAQISGTVARGTYTVEVLCDGTNDRGKVSLKVVKATESTPSVVPTKAPKAGGGGTFAQDTEEDSSVPLGPAGVLIGLALAAGIGLAIKRRNRA